MVVVDGCYFSPKHYAYENCAEDLHNYRDAVFCAVHEQTHGAKCHVCNCDNLKIRATQACQQHQQQWKNLLLNAKDNLHLGSEELHNDNLKTCHGVQLLSGQNNHMMGKWKK